MGNCVPKAAPPAAAAAPGAPRAAAGSMRGGGSFRSQAEPRNGVRPPLRIVSRLALAAAGRCGAVPSKGTRSTRRGPLRALLAASTLPQALCADAPPAPAWCAGQAGVPQVRQGLRAQVGRHAAEPAEALVRTPLRPGQSRGTFAASGAVLRKDRVRARCGTQASRGARALHGVHRTGASCRPASWLRCGDPVPDPSGKCGAAGCGCRTSSTSCAAPASVSTRSRRSGSRRRARERHAAAAAIASRAPACAAAGAGQAAPGKDDEVRR